MLVRISSLPKTEMSARVDGVLVVEDDIDMCNLIRGHLEAGGYTVYQAFDGPGALKLVEQHTPRLVILDWMLPGMDGLEVCRQIRRTHLMPIMMLTARGEEVDRVLGLEVGADDYVVKPFSIRELMARVRAILRRVALDSQAALAAPVGGASAEVAGDPDGASASVEASAIVCGALRIDPLTHLATLDGAPLELTPREFDLLRLFAANPGRAFSREYLVKRLWGYDYDGFDRTVDTHITRLRKKLGYLGEAIVTVWGVGYRFVP
jgi:DNA-binding response OmpR family regulator